MDEAAIDACFALLLHDDAQARTPLEQAFAAAAAAGDEAAQHVVAAAALLAINVEFCDFRGQARWIERFEAGERAAPRLTRELDRQRVDGARLVLPSLDDRYAHGSVPARAAAQRLFEAIARGAGPFGDEGLLLAKALYDHLVMESDMARCERLAAFVDERLRSGSAGTAWRWRWAMVQEVALNQWGHREAAAASLREQMAALVLAGPTPSMALAQALLELHRALRDDDTAAQDRAFAEIDRLRSQLRPGLVLRGMSHQAVMLLRREHYHAALGRLDTVLGLCDDIEVPERDRGLYHEQRAYALAGLHRWGEALAAIGMARPHQRGQQLQMIDTIGAALRAAGALDEGAPDAQALALAAVRSAAAADWRRVLRLLPRHAARLAECALEAGVETEFVRTVIHEQRLVPADRHRAVWPWRLRLHALGALRIERDGRAIADSGKAQRKPLDLLRLLVAHGGRPLAADAVIDQLWPSPDANAPKGSLDMAVLRLRKLLGLPEALVVTDGRLGLAGDLVWTDVAAFEARCDAADRGDGSAAEAALALYGGALLGAEDAQGLLRACRQRLALRYTRLVLDHGARLEAAASWPAAQRLYERGLVGDPLAEPLYRALMRVQLQCDERAEALRTFRRCRELLSEVLGAQPAAETLALAQRAQLLG